MKNPYEDKIREQGLVDQIPTGEGFVDIFDPEWVAKRQQDWEMIEPFHKSENKDDLEYFNYFKEFFFTGISPRYEYKNTPAISFFGIFYYPHESIQGWTHFVEHSECVLETNLEGQYDCVLV